MVRRDHRAIALKAARSRARRRKALGIEPKCSNCGAPRDRLGSTYCRTCHATYMREWRKSHPLNDEQRAKDSVRSTAGYNKRRGKLIPQPCMGCGASDVEMHHPDYAKPLEVEWLCRSCHVALHNPAPYAACSGCGEPRDTTGVYCKKCRAEYMRHYREARANRKKKNGLRKDAESVSRKTSRGVARDTSAAPAASEEVTMAEPEDLMPQAGLAQPPDPTPALRADPPPAGEGEEAAAAPATKPVPAKPTLVAGAPRKSQGDLAAIAGQLMIDRVRRLMAVAKDLGTAAAQLETLTASILTGGAAAATAPPDPGKLEATHFFLALDLLLVRIEERSQRVAVQAARLDRLFDLDVKPTAQAS